jgi:hypothetical protein
MDENESIEKKICPSQRELNDLWRSRLPCGV